MSPGQRGWTNKWGTLSSSLLLCPSSLRATCKVNTVTQGEGQPEVLSASCHPLPPPPHHLTISFCSYMYTSVFPKPPSSKSRLSDTSCYGPGVMGNQLGTSWSCFPWQRRWLLECSMDPWFEPLDLYICISLISQQHRSPRTETTSYLFIYPPSLTNTHPSNVWGRWSIQQLMT